jgi:hypothetical protein
MEMVNIVSEQMARTTIYPDEAKNSRFEDLCIFDSVEAKTKDAATS